MSNSVVFLVGVVVLSLLGGFVLWLRERAPRSMEAHMKAFERELNALSPESPEQPRRRPAPRPPAPRPPAPRLHDRPRGYDRPRPHDRSRTRGPRPG